jgi:divinyl protochlorophyllide a 8-vinyl-reductase
VSATHAPVPRASVGARIGPNAVTRVAEALQGVGGRPLATTVFDRAGLSRYLHAPPDWMVDEREVARLHQALRQVLPQDQAERVARDAGTRTADYLLAHRIPQPVQALLQPLPAAMAARLLLRAIGRHAWTFAGSGRFEATAGGWRPASRGGRPFGVVLHDNPTCRGLHATAPACGYQAAVFQRLFTSLVHPDAVVAERCCSAAGGDACRFELRW